MNHQDPKSNLPFLVWLERYIGTWTLDGEERQIRRRADGWLFVLLEEAPLAQLIHEGKKIEDSPGPLGPRPVVLSKALMQRWLSDEECKRFRYAFAVSSGMRILVETIEKRMNEVSDEERLRVLKQEWIDTPHDDAWSPEDRRLLAKLWKKYRDSDPVGETIRMLLAGEMPIFPEANEYTAPMLEVTESELREYLRGRYTEDQIEKLITQKLDDI